MFISPWLCLVTHLLGLGSKLMLICHSWEISRAPKNFHMSSIYTAGRLISRPHTKLLVFRPGGRKQMLLLVISGESGSHDLTSHLPRCFDFQFFQSWVGLQFGLHYISKHLHPMASWLGLLMKTACAGQKLESDLITINMTYAPVFGVSPSLLP